MDESQNRIDMQSFDSITDQVLKYKPPRGSVSQPRPAPVDANESTPGSSKPNSTSNMTDEAQRTKNRD